MSVMRGVAPFDALWARRTSITLGDGTTCEMLSLPDLVSAKKTQRDKDWPMIRRLVEAHYASHSREPGPEAVAFWLREARTPDILMRVALTHPQECRALASGRPVIRAALAADAGAVAAALAEEEAIEREADRAYWRPLRAELETMRHALLRGGAL
jgi:hypothetical protein